MAKYRALGTIPKRTFLCAIVLAFCVTNALADDGSSEGWKWRAELYGWGASLGGSTTSGGDVDVDFDRIFDDLYAGAMGLVIAKKGKLSFFADMIYLDVGEKDTTTANIGPVSVVAAADIDLKGFIATTGVGYRFYEASGTSLDVTGGIRYLWLDGDIDVDINVPVPPITRSVSESESGSNWDAVVGLRGQTDLSNKWYLTYYGDVGAGDSDLTWQAAAAVNYRLEKVTLSLGYRYLEWDFDDFGPFNDLDLSGAFAGVIVPF